MANKKITDLNPATTPLSGAEQIELVQSGESKRAPINALSTPFNLQVYEEGDTPISNVNEIEVIGATVTDDGGGKVTLEVVGGGMENVTQRIFTVMLSDIGATDFTDDIPGKIKTYAIANGIQKLPNETHDWEVIQDFNFYLRISGTEMYDNWGVEDEGTFISYLAGQALTNIAVTDFYLSADTLRCNLSFDGNTVLDLGFFGITKIVNLDSLVNLDTLYLGDNQLTTIENLDALVNLTYLDLKYNQLTKIENLDSLVNLNGLYLSDNQLTTSEFNKLNSWAILAPNNGEILASNNIDNFNLSTTYTTLLAKGWVIS